jgi:hypothetical protein
MALAIDAQDRPILAGGSTPMIDSEVYTAPYAMAVWRLTP